MPVIETIFAEVFDDSAVDAMCECGDQLILRLGMHQPIRCTLSDAAGLPLAKFGLEADEPAETLCNPIEGRLRSQEGASLRLTDPNGVVVEVLLVIGTPILQ